MSPRTTSKVTVDHDEIRRWAEERGARPAAVGRSQSDDGPGIIRLAFPGARKSRDNALEEISWNEWFERFDENHLALLHQEETAAGERSNFNKIISRETAAEAERATGGKGRSATPRENTAARPRAAGRWDGRETTARKPASARGKGASSSRARSRAVSATSGGAVAARHGHRGRSVSRARPAGQLAQQRKAGRNHSSQQPSAVRKRAPGDPT